MQKYIRDEVKGFLPTLADLDYPAKFVIAEQDNASLYATWYHSLEYTLMCLCILRQVSPNVSANDWTHYFNVLITLAERRRWRVGTNAIQICAASLKMAPVEISAI